MARKRKFEPITLGDSHYYDPKTSDQFIIHNARYHFLKAVETRTPEVLRSLRHDVWPAYEKTYWQMFPRQTSDTWKYSLHPELVASWIEKKEPTRWIDLGQSAPNDLRDRVLAWARDHHISKDWVLHQALNTMFTWTENESSPRRSLNVENARSRIARALGSSKPERDSSWDLKTYRWHVQRHWFFGRAEQKQFGYTAWMGERPSDFKRRTRVEFAAHLKAYMVEVEERSKALRRVPSLTKPEMFDMLALYLCRGMKRDELQALFRKDVTGIYRDLREAAELVDLSLKRPGRPKLRNPVSAE